MREGSRGRLEQSGCARNLLGAAGRALSRRLGGADQKRRCELVSGAPLRAPCNAHPPPLLIYNFQARVTPLQVAKPEAEPHAAEHVPADTAGQAASATSG